MVAFAGDGLWGRAVHPGVESAGDGISSAGAVHQGVAGDGISWADGVPWAGWGPLGGWGSLGKLRSLGRMGSFGRAGFLGQAGSLGQTGLWLAAGAVEREHRGVGFQGGRGSREAVGATALPV